MRFFPSQDGPSHLYNARLLTALLDPANARLREFFEFNPGLHPNLLAHALLAGLQAVVPPLLAEKILLTALVVLLPLSLLCLLRAVERGRDVYALAALPFAYHHLLHLGFYSFSLGLSLCFFTLAFFWPRRTRVTLGGVLGVIGLLVTSKDRNAEERLDSLSGRGSSNTGTGTGSHRTGPKTELTSEERTTERLVQA